MGQILPIFKPSKSIPPKPVKLYISTQAGLIYVPTSQIPKNSEPICFQTADDSFYELKGIMTLDQIMATASSREYYAAFPSSFYTNKGVLPNKNAGDYYFVYQRVPYPLTATQSQSSLVTSSPGWNKGTKTYCTQPAWSPNYYNPVGADLQDFCTNFKTRSNSSGKTWTDTATCMNDLRTSSVPTVPCTVNYSTPVYNAYLTPSIAGIAGIESSQTATSAGDGFPRPNGTPCDLSGKYADVTYTPQARDIIRYCNEQNPNDKTAAMNCANNLLRVDGLYPTTIPTKSTLSGTTCIYDPVADEGWYSATTTTSAYLQGGAYNPAVTTTNAKYQPCLPCQSFAGNQTINYECMKQIWKNSIRLYTNNQNTTPACTTDAPWSSWHQGQTKNDLIYDAYLWATMNDKTHVSGCYGWNAWMAKPCDNPAQTKNSNGDCVCPNTCGSGQTQRSDCSCTCPNTCNWWQDQGSDCVCRDRYCGYYSWDPWGADRDAYGNCVCPPGNEFNVNCGYYRTCCSVNSYSACCEG